MDIRLSLVQKDNFKQIIWYAVKIIAISILVFVVSAFVTLVLLYLYNSGFSESSFSQIKLSLLKLSKNPFFFLEIYERWWRLFVESKNSTAFSSGFFIVLFPIYSASLFLLVSFVKSSYAFGLWYMLNSRFAKHEDIKKMGLFNSAVFVLGRFKDHILGLSQPTSILCIGGFGAGKTSSVAIPSVLRSNRSSVVAVDKSGALLKYTSGYRAKLGKVFYFNWNLQDNIAENEFYPRWNPLSEKNMPKDEVKKNKYLDFIAACLIGYRKKDDKDNYWKWLSYLAMKTSIHFYVSKVAQAKANDFFLNKIIEKKRFTLDDKDILLSYYAGMSNSLAKNAMEKLQKGDLSIDDYCPIGSWDGIDSAWQGKSVCLAMLSDCIMKYYFNNNYREEGDVNKRDLSNFILEAKLFNYNINVIDGLTQLSCLSNRQREIIFPMFLKTTVLVMDSFCILYRFVLICG